MDSLAVEISRDRQLSRDENEPAFLTVGEAQI
jgi:hypothetical protein